MGEETLDDIIFIKDMVETDNESVKETNQNDIMSLVSTSECKNDICDFGEDIIPSEDEIKEDNTKNTILEHDETDGKTREIKWPIEKENVVSELKRSKRTKKVKV